MTRPTDRIAITGLGRSGTSFVSAVLHAAGYDFGPESPDQIGTAGRLPGAGMEFQPVYQTSTRIARSPYADQIAACRQTLDSHELPQAVKCPLFLPTLRAWYAAGYHPDRVVICLRNWRAVSESFAHYQRPDLEERLTWQHDLIAWLAYRGIPTHFVLYPHVGRERACCERTLSPLVPDPWPIVQSLWNPQLNHFG